MARSLARALGYSWCPVDYLGAMMSRYVPDGAWASPFPVEEGCYDNDVRFAVLSDVQIIENYRAKARKTWLGLQAFIDYAMSESRDFILEGFQIEPAFADQVIQTYGRAHIRALFLYKSDVDAIVTGLRNGRDPHDWVLCNTKKPETFDKIAVMINRYSVIVGTEARKFECAAMLMDGPFEEQVSKAVKFLARGQ